MHNTLRDYSLTFCSDISTIHQMVRCTNYCRKAIPCASESKRYLFILYHIISLSIFVLSRLLFISWSSPPSSLFNLPGVQLYLKVPNHLHALKWYVIHWLIFLIYWMFIYAFVLAGTFPRYKPSYKLKLYMS